MHSYVLDTSIDSFFLFNCPYILNTLMQSDFITLCALGSFCNDKHVFGFLCCFEAVAAAEDLPKMVKGLFMKAGRLLFT